MFLRTLTHAPILPAGGLKLPHLQQKRMTLFPGHRRINGELLIGGVRAGELAATYGTPVLALDYDVVDTAIAAFTSACSAHRIEIAYSGKALLLVGLARHLKHTALGLDVSSIGELAAAERAGFPPERINMHGCGKTEEELAAAAAGRVGRVIVDNIDELERLASTSGEAAQVRVLLRINTGIQAHTHEFVQTSGEGSKFGFDTESVASAIRVLRSAPHLRFVGLHSHIGSQIYEQSAFTANAAALMERAAYCAEASLQSSEIIVGGGFGVMMHPDRHKSLDLASTMSEIAQTIQKEAQRWRLPLPRVGIEPGRALIAHAGTSLYTVMAVKRQFTRPYAIIDGGVFENPRPALYDAYHHIIPASRESTDVAETIVCGRTCENDRLGTGLLPEDLHVGELVAMCTTGAYTYSMASNYNRFTRPAVVAVRQGTHSLIARRETLDDVLKVDCDA
jgi:diaminopimelate decarboxylase